MNEKLTARQLLKRWGWGDDLMRLYTELEKGLPATLGRQPINQLGSERISSHFNPVNPEGPDFEKKMFRLSFSLEMAELWEEGGKKAIDAHHEALYFGRESTRVESTKFEKLDDEVDLGLDDEIDLGLDDEITDVLERAEKEVEKIYAPIKKIGYSGRGDVDARSGQWKGAALGLFLDNQNEFELVTRSHLEADNLYVLNPNHGRRDFIGNLLMQIVEDQTGRKIGSQRLFAEYTKVKKTT